MFEHDLEKIGSAVSKERAASKWAGNPKKLAEFGFWLFG